jgi:NADH-dependent fumarate reductase subunit C
VLYKAQGKPVDLYGHPADPKGMGSLCSKGITLVQEVAQNPLRLLGFYLWQGQELLNISQEQAKGLIKERLRGKVAIVLDRHLSSLEEYLLAKQLGDVFVDAPVLGYKPSEVFFNQWQNYMLIIGWEAEPVFSEIMSMRYLVDAVERSAHLVCVSARYATLCAKAKRQVLLNPIKQLSFMNSLLEPGHTDPLVVELKRAMHLVKTLLLVGTDLLASSFRNQVLSILYKLKKRFEVDYSFVGDLTPLPAKELRELVGSIEDYDSFVFFGNPLVQLPQEVRERIKEKFSVHFTLFPNLTSPSLCTHMGCPVVYSKKRFLCACHYSLFDPAKNGQSYQGHASEWLPQIILRFEPRTGDIYAEGVEGLIWGRVRNVLKTTKK